MIPVFQRAKVIPLFRGTKEIKVNAVPGWIKKTPGGPNLAFLITGNSRGTAPRLHTARLQLPPGYAGAGDLNEHPAACCSLPRPACDTVRARSISSHSLSRQGLVVLNSGQCVARVVNLSLRVRDHGECEVRGAVDVTSGEFRVDICDSNTSLPPSKSTNAH